MMRKLLVLTAVVTLTISTAGCRCNWWPWRRAYCDPCAPVYSSPPACPADPCDPCATPGGVTPGPQPYGGVSG